jgi:Mg2+/Co2+ transporter CorC
MILIDHQATTKELLNVMIESAHSRFPIINNEQHKILGVILGVNQSHDSLQPLLKIAVIHHWSIVVCGKIVFLIFVKKTMTREVVLRSWGYFG